VENSGGESRAISRPGCSAAVLVLVGRPI